MSTALINVDIHYIHYIHYTPMKKPFLISQSIKIEVNGHLVEIILNLNGLHLTEAIPFQVNSYGVNIFLHKVDKIQIKQN